ncbi:zinc ribbon domain-containing protein [Fontivita pretiosa]|uniref:zinc ribbon domain-containing protein n=1 Tax=Fontivita pretiosa TaxID=2989684 RepID=UPI003D16C8AD
MTALSPTIRIPPPQHEPDLLAGAVLRSLTRPLYRRVSAGPLLAVLASVISGGVLTLLLLPRWLRDLIAQEQQQLWHLAEWMRLQSGDVDATDLQPLAQQVRLNIPLALLTWLCCGAALAVVFAHFAERPFTPAELGRFVFSVPSGQAPLLYTVAISAAAVLHWIHVVWHQLNVERYIRYFNHLLLRQQQPELPLPKLELGLRPVWIALGVGLSAAGGLWGLPLMLAAAAHRRYTTRSSVRQRAELAERLRAMLLQRRPMMRVPRPISVMRTCIRPNCRAAIPTVANFCPRCGTRAVARAMEVVA